MRSSTSVVLAFRGRNDVELPAGSGLLVPRIEGAVFSSLTFVHAKWPTRVRSELALVRIVVDQARVSDDTLIEDILRDLRRFVRVGDPLWTAVERFPFASASRFDRPPRTNA